jgi:hypothetical protein
VSGAQTHDLKLTCPPAYPLGYCVELIMKKKYKSYQNYRCWTRMRVESIRVCVELTRMPVIVYFKRPQLYACSLGLWLYCKVVQYAACENHTHDSDIAVVSRVDWFWTFCWISNSLSFKKFEKTSFILEHILF